MGCSCLYIAKVAFFFTLHVKFCQEPLYSYPLHRISYCADDKRDKKLFAFIAKDSGAQHHSCYVFECDKMVRTHHCSNQCDWDSWMLMLVVALKLKYTPYGPVDAVL